MLRFYLLKNALASTMDGDFQKGEITMLWVIFMLLIILWLSGLIANVGGALIHLVLFAAAIVLIINLLSGRRTTEFFCRHPHTVAQAVSCR